MVVFWLLADGAADGRPVAPARVVVFVQAAIGVSSIAFGGLNWALDGAAAPVAALGRFEAAVGRRGVPATQARRVAPATGAEGDPVPRRVVRLRRWQATARVLDGFDLTIPAGTSLAIVGQNGAGKTTLAKLLCRLYDPTAGSIEIDGVPLTDRSTSRRGARRSPPCSRTSSASSCRCATTSRRPGAPDDVVRAALADAGADDLADGDLDTILSKGYPGGTDLSGGQWQRVALARALCAVRQGAGVVLLDEPTAQLDVRGEAEIFERVLAATRHCTTILISHRFSTVRSGRPHLRDRATARSSSSAPTTS